MARSGSGTARNENIQGKRWCENESHPYVDRKIASRKQIQRKMLIVRLKSPPRNGIRKLNQAAAKSARHRTGKDCHVGIAAPGCPEESQRSSASNPTETASTSKVEEYFS